MRQLLFLVLSAFAYVNLHSQSYALLTYNDDFSGAGTALSSNWSTSFSNSAGRIERRNLSGSWPQFGTTTAANGTATSGNGLAIYNTSNLASDNTLNADLYLRLQDVVNARLNFSIVDWGTAYAANPLRVFLSTNGGVSFGATSTVVPLNLSPHADGIWNNITIDINSLATANGLILTNTSVVRFAFTLRGSGNVSNPKSGNQFVYVDNLTATGSTALPVELFSFSAKDENGFHNLEWVTLAEIDNSHFEVQRSYNGVDFEVIGIVAGNGTSNQLNYYVFQYLAADKAKDFYYRLKQVDGDGDFEYSNVVVLSSNVSAELEIKSGQIQCTACGVGDVSLYDGEGKLLFAGDQHSALSLSNVSNGVYLIQFVSKDKSVYLSKKVRVLNSY